VRSRPGDLRLARERTKCLAGDGVSPLLAGPLPAPDLAVAGRDLEVAFLVEDRADLRRSLRDEGAAAVAVEEAAEAAARAVAGLALARAAPFLADQRPAEVADDREAGRLRGFGRHLGGCLG